MHTILLKLLRSAARAAVYQAKSVALGLLILLPMLSLARVLYPPAASLAPGDITTTHISNATILDIDVSSSTKIMATKLEQTGFDLSLFGGRGILSTTGTLPVSRGGTGLNTVTSAGLMSGNGTAPMSATSIVAINYGGTGISSYAAGDVLGVNDQAQLTKLTAGTDNYVLTYDSTAAANIKWASSGASPSSVLAMPTRGFAATANVVPNSGTTADYGQFFVPFGITVSSVTFSIQTFSGAGTFMFAIYNEGGTSRLTMATGTVAAAGRFTLDVPDFAITPGNYSFLLRFQGGTMTFAYTESASPFTNWSTPAGTYCMVGSQTVGPNTVDLPTTVNPYSITSCNSPGNQVLFMLNKP